MAAYLRAESCRGGGDDDGAHALALCILQDLLGAAAFLASHPLHAAYALFFSRYLLSLAAFFCPLLVSTSLLLAVLVTVGPYVSPGWPGVRSLGRTCGIAVGALCAELRPDGAAVGLVGQLCSFVLGSADGAGVVRVGEIMGELCDTSGSCFLLEERSFLLSTEDCSKLAADLPLQTLIGEKIFLGHEGIAEIKDEIEDKVVVCEDLKEFKGSDSSSEQSCSSDTSVQEMEEEDGVSDGKRLECDPVSMEIKKCELVTSHSSVSRRIRLWEAQVCAKIMQVPEETQDNCLEFSLEKEALEDVKESVQFETEALEEKCNENLQTQEIASVEESVQQQQEEEFKDVKQSETEISSEKCSEELQAEELCAPIAQPEQELEEQSHKDVQAEPELQEQEYRGVQPEQESQEHSHMNVQAIPELHGQEYNKGDDESESLCDDARDNSLKSTWIARRVHSRTSSENLVSEGESPRKEKEWKRTLACKLYEERMQLKLCRDRAVVGCSDDMDMLWEAYEAGGGGNAAGDMNLRGGDKAKGAKKQEDSVEEGEHEEEEEDEDHEGPVRQLCCLQALKFSTRKMNLGGGKPSLAKISKVLKRMTALSRVGSRRNIKG